jgi:ATP-dependent Clp protease protease subunit
MRHEDLLLNSPEPQLVLDPITEDNLIKSRRIQLAGEVTDNTALYINSHLQNFAASKDPVLIYITSPGGDLSAGYAIIDQMELSPFPIYTIIRGQANSMGAIIAAYGTKGCRFITRNSSVMLHQILVCSAKIENIVEHKRGIDYMHEDFNQKIIDLAKRTKLTPTQLSKILLETKWMNAKEATKIGVVDGLWTKKLEKQFSGTKNNDQKKDN